MIQFILKQQSYDDQDVTVTVSTHLEHLDGAVNAFKTFLRHVGFHADNVDCVVYTDIHEERQALPEQRDWVNDCYADDGKPL